MSIRVLAQVWDSGVYDGGTLLVLLAMADWASDEGTRIFPTISKLAAKARLSDRQVQRALDTLRDEDGIVEIVKAARGKPGLANEYRIDLELLRTVSDLVRAEIDAGLSPSEARKIVVIAGYKRGRVTSALTPPNAADHGATISTGDIVSVADQSRLAPAIATIGGEIDGCQNVVTLNRESGSTVTGDIGVEDGCHGSGKGVTHPIETGDIGGSYIDKPLSEPSSKPSTLPSYAGVSAVVQLPEETRGDEIPFSLLRDPVERIMRMGPWHPSPSFDVKRELADAKEAPPIDEILAGAKRYFQYLALRDAKRPKDDPFRAVKASTFIRKAMWNDYPPPERLPRSKERKHVWGGHPAVPKLIERLGEGVFDQMIAPTRLKIVDYKPPIILAPTALIRDILETKHWQAIEWAFGMPVPVQLDAEASVAA